MLANDTDADGDTLTAVLVTGPSHGSLTLNANGSFTYTPAADFTGSDSFTYKANDGTADSNVATVNITVNPLNTILVTAAWLAAARPGTIFPGPSEYDLCPANGCCYARGRRLPSSTAEITLDLNGHTVTYDQIGGGVPNANFEAAGSSADVPASPDLNNAPGATRVSTFTNAIEGRWSLTIADTGHDQTIVSGWAASPPSAKATAYFIGMMPFGRFACRSGWRSNMKRWA